MRFELWYNLVMENKQIDSNLLVKEHQKDKQLIISSVLILIQLLFIFWLGYVTSKFNPGAPWATAETFYASSLSVILGIFILPAFGIITTIYSFYQLLKKKNFSILVWFLLLTSISFATILPLNYFSDKVAGLFNPLYTKQGQAQQEIQRQQKKVEIQKMFEEDPLVDFNSETTRKLIEKRDQLLVELYQKIKLDIDGEHKIISSDPANLRITIDSGKTYILNTDSIIRKTADIKTIETYQGIMNGGYKKNTYIFNVGSYKEFENYYNWSFKEVDNLQNSVDNFKNSLFVISIPTIKN